MEKDVVGSDAEEASSSDEILQSVIQEKPEALENCTSAVFSLDSFDFTGVEEEAPRTKFASDFDRVIYETSTEKYLVPYTSHIPLVEQPKPVIQIVDAQKVTASTSYIVYMIRSEFQGIKYEASHRYSEFEALRKLLVKAYPTCVVPPIPEKHSVKDYVGKPGKAKEDPKIIMKRTRLLQSFLNRVAAHPILSSSPVFQRFLTGDSWSEILSSSGLEHLLKKKGFSMGKPNLKKPDQHFQNAQDFTARFYAQMGYIHKIFKRISDQYQVQNECYAQLGAQYNSWSLAEEQLADTLENTGEVFDKMNILTGKLDQQLRIVDDLMFEYLQFSTRIEKVLLWRHRKHAEFESISENLIIKQGNLQKLESSEHESQRLNAALSQEGALQTPGDVPYKGSTQTGILATINSFIDNDPEQTRRNNISKTKDAIGTLEDARETTRLELIKSNADIQRDLNRFQKQKINDIRSMFLVLAMANKEYHSKALKAWTAAKGALK